SEQPQPELSLGARRRRRPAANSMIVLLHQNRLAFAVVPRVTQAMPTKKPLAFATLASVLLTATPALFSAAPIDLAAAHASDPVTLGWMVGAPPPADKMIRFADGSYYRFPQW